MIIITVMVLCSSGLICIGCKNFVKKPSVFVDADDFVDKSMASITSNSDPNLPLVVSKQSIQNNLIYFNSDEIM